MIGWNSICRLEQIAPQFLGPVAYSRMLLSCLCHFPITHPLFLATAAVATLLFAFCSMLRIRLVLS